MRQAKYRVELNLPEAGKVIFEKHPFHITVLRAVNGFSLIIKKHSSSSVWRPSICSYEHYCWLDSSQQKKVDRLFKKIEKECH